MLVNLGPVTFAPGFSCNFPAGLCPNCGAKDALTTAVQKTVTVTSFFLVAGTELTLPFPMTVCCRCLPTLERRPRGFVQKLFITALSIATVAVFLLFAVVTNQVKSAFLQNHMWVVSILLGGAVPAVWFGLRRPRDPQTSFYQPVRIRALKRAFVSGEIQSISLAFTNKEYMRAFSKLNSAVIKQGYLQATSA
jgi:hypothetical protein